MRQPSPSGGEPDGGQTQQPDGNEPDGGQTQQPSGNDPSGGSGSSGGESGNSGSSGDSGSSSGEPTPQMEDGPVRSQECSGSVVEAPIDGMPLEMESIGSTETVENQEAHETADPLVTTQAAFEPTAATQTLPEAEKPGTDIWGILFWISAALLAGDLIAILFLSYRIDIEMRSIKDAKERPLVVPDKKQLQLTAIGTVHQIGRRGYQQDSLGHSAVFGGKGVLAVLADGMGGLSDGDKISQKIVMEMLTLGQKLTPGRTNGILKKMLAQVNEDVNQTLGTKGLYKSGSTMVAVLVQGTQFQWIAVGDSRIYLYRQGYVNQLNQDHDQLQVWMADVLEGKRSMEEVLRNPDGRKLTSFIGMGQLKYVDASLNAIGLEPGDRLVLMSDGVYNVLGEDRLAAILKQCPDVNHAASTMERLIEQANNPHQDNYTAMILGF